MLVAIGIDWDRRRQVLVVELADRESATSWPGLSNAALRGASGRDRRSRGSEKAVADTLSTSLWQRCYVHFLRNALDRIPRAADRTCLQELRWL